TELEKEEIQIKAIALGRLQIVTNGKTQQLIERIARENGFELMKNPLEQLVEQTKIALIQYVRDLETSSESRNRSAFLSQKLHRDYSKISRTFSRLEGLTIEKYFINLKIERVKELIQLGQYNFTEIADKLDYSNVNHLSSQFKAETGMNLSNYKALKNKTRKPYHRIA